MQNVRRHTGNKRKRNDRNLRILRYGADIYTSSALSNSDFKRSVLARLKRLPTTSSVIFGIVCSVPQYSQVAVVSFSFISSVPPHKVYNKIVGLDNTQSEAYWGIILCKYGIEYVDVCAFRFHQFPCSR